MAKWAICNKDTGALSDICSEEDKFEIYEGPDADLKWVPVPDDCTFEHRMINGAVVHRADTEDLREDAIIDEGFNLEVIWEKDWDLIDAEINSTRDA